MQGAKRSPYVDMGKLCNAAADDPRRNPFNDIELNGTNPGGPQRRYSST
jgi:hypothetical protein